MKFMAWSGYTAVFEILSPDHQHVVDLSYLSRYINIFLSILLGHCGNLFKKLSIGFEIIN